MQQVWRWIIISLFLGMCSLEDIRSRMLPISWLVSFGFGSMLLLLREAIHNHADPVFLVLQLILGLIPGICTIIMAKITEEGIGMGDGIVILIMGILIPVHENVLILLTALFICSVVSLGSFFLNNFSFRKSLPFLPFLLGGFVLNVIPRAWEMMK